VAYLQDGTSELVSRNRNVFGGFKGLRTWLDEKLRVWDAIIDGEICLDESGTRFNDAQPHTTPCGKIRPMHLRLVTFMHARELNNSHFRSGTPMRIVAWCLILGILLVDSPSVSAKSTIAEQVARIKSERKIKVKLKTDEIVKGRIGNVAADQFSVKTDRGERQIRFVEVESVKPDGLTGNPAERSRRAIEPPDS
jgi:hypothetical protein